ncbi:MAG: hypothetical protein HYV09_00330 [Deltaproteobacteria bacterium]|nr:hypothetical protein [Deltaproteobacteria bacterium]
MGEEDGIAQRSFRTRAVARGERGRAPRREDLEAIAHAMHVHGSERQPGAIGGISLGVCAARERIVPVAAPRQQVGAPLIHPRHVCSFVEDLRLLDRAVGLRQPGQGTEHPRRPLL